MATNYTTWAKVLELYKRADDVEPAGADQTALMEEMTQMFQGYIRHLHKNDLTTVDAIVNKAVAHLCIEELRTRVATNLNERTAATFDHISGMFFPEGIKAHSLIDSIRQKKYVLVQDATAHDVHNPEVLPAAGNTGAGIIRVYLPHEWKEEEGAVFKLECTTSGRVDDATARFSIERDNEATDSTTDATPSVDWAHIVSELYWRAFDDSDSGNSFVSTDTWSFTVFAPGAVVQTTGPRQVNFFRS